MIPLNEHGLCVWKNMSDRTMFAEKPYAYQDRVLIIQEVPNLSGGRDRIVKCEGPISSLDKSRWMPVSKEEFLKVKRYFSDIYGVPYGY